MSPPDTVYGLEFEKSKRNSWCPYITALRPDWRVKTVHFNCGSCFNSAEAASHCVMLSTEFLAISARFHMCEIITAKNAEWVELIISKALKNDCVTIVPIMESVKTKWFIVWIWFGCFFFILIHFKFPKQNKTKNQPQTIGYYGHNNKPGAKIK